MYNNHMIRIGVVDDEPPALKRISRLLSEFPNVVIAGMYTDPEELLEQTVAGRFDLVLLDMEMPELHGLELAKEIYRLYPTVYIAFITAYEQFAQPAYDVEAIDYIMKPVLEENLTRTIRRYVQRKRQSQTEDHSQSQVRTAVLPASFRCFGWFTVTTEQQEMIRFRNSKSRELLAFLHSHGGNPVSKSKIIEALWPGRDNEKALVTLHSTVYQLRKDMEAFDLKEVIAQEKGEGGSYRLRMPPMYDELSHFRQLGESFWRDGHVEDARLGIKLYQEGLWKEHDWEWAAKLKWEMETSYHGLLEGVIEFELAQERYREAIPYLMLKAGSNPYHEELQGRIIASFLLAEDHEGALNHFIRTLQLFKSDLGIGLMFSYDQIARDPKAYL
ncbi:response regulator [Paenibacillus gorillae]|uniref:response regulator n=1 Tax=Paenibacillus gorillae TaxID=1243662 RepID=UPI0004B533D2|nr:response regulator [Paenibacillus gorillae]